MIKVLASEGFANDELRMAVCRMIPEVVHYAINKLPLSWPPDWC